MREKRRRLVDGATSASPRCAALDREIDRVVTKMGTVVARLGWATFAAFTVLTFIGHVIWIVVVDYRFWGPAPSDSWIYSCSRWLW